MKGKPARLKEPQACARVAFKVNFSTKSRRISQARVPQATSPDREKPPSGPSLLAPTRSATLPAPDSIPKASRLLVVGYYFEQLLEEGKVQDYAEIARLTGLSRARVTQIVDRSLMDRQTQESLLTWGPSATTMRTDQPVLPHWTPGT